MTETLEIPVTYKNKEILFSARVIRFGYVNHIIVDLDGVEITIERDEEGNYRALGDIEKIRQSKIDVELIGTLIEVLQSL
jgi:transposase